MKKAGILTFHNALSYGAALQSLALQQFLSSNGIENDIIDYECDYINKNYKRILCIDKNHVLKSFVGSLLRAGCKRKSIRLSRQFREKYMKLSENCSRRDIREKCQAYALFIAGSDQVWSPGCAGFDKTYFLDFAQDRQKYSYAASFGTAEIPEEKAAEYHTLLQGFQGLSVREDSGAELTKQTAGKQAEVHVDPTLLLGRDFWETIAEKEIQPEQPYILAFSVQKPRTLLSYAAKLGREKRMPVYYLNDLHFPLLDGIRYLDPVSPAGFVGLIRNASYVVTNSFHACVFALIYHRPFMVEVETLGARNNRCEELLRKLQISGREILPDRVQDPDAFIDWERAEQIIAHEKSRSREYIQQIRKQLDEQGHHMQGKKEGS